MTRIHEWFLGIDQRTFATIVIIVCMVVALVFPGSVR